MTLEGLGESKTRLSSLINGSQVDLNALQFSSLETSRRNVENV